jgi:hypothetical protein
MSLEDIRRLLLGSVSLALNLKVYDTMDKLLKKGNVSGALVVLVFYYEIGEVEDEDFKALGKLLAEYLESS